MLLNKTDLDSLLSEMTLKQKAFCEEYIQFFNGTKSAITAGYSKNAAGVAASQLLNQPNVSRYLGHLKEKREIRTGVTADMVVAELAKIAFQDVRDLIQYENGELSIRDFKDIKHTCVIKEFDIKSLMLEGTPWGNLSRLKTHDKLKALELLGKHTNAFTENINHTNNGESFQQAVHEVIINHREPGKDLEK